MSPSGIDHYKRHNSGNGNQQVDVHAYDRQILIALNQPNPKMKK